MIDYRDFIQYAEIDLEISKSLFGKKQYGNAAYHTQQALEKYLKAYFLKSNLIENVQKLGHLQYPEIINEATNIFQSQKSKEDNAMTKMILEETIKHYSGIKEMFTKVQQSQDNRILFWKASIGIELTKREKDILNGIRVTNEKNTSNFVSVISESVKTGDFSKIISDAGSIPSELKAGIPDMLGDFVESIVKKDIKPGMREKFLSLLEPHLYGTGTDSFSKSESDTVIKISAIDKSFDWYEHVLLTYPHQEIGRYPTMIDDKDSYSLYEEYKENLWQIMEEIQSVCSGIRNSIIEIKNL